MPASRSGWRKPVRNDIAHPWEKPAITIRAAGGLLAGDQRLDGGLGTTQAGLVLALGQVGAHDVVPGRHPVAAIDGDRDHRRVREHEAHRADRGQVELVGDRDEVIAVGTQAVHEEDGGHGIRAGFDFDGWI
jgi:hypothetical protein